MFSGKQIITSLKKSQSNGSFTLLLRHALWRYGGSEDPWDHYARTKRRVSRLFTLPDIIHPLLPYLVCPGSSLTVFLLVRLAPEEVLSSWDATVEKGRRVDCRSGLIIHVLRLAFLTSAGVLRTLPSAAFGSNQERSVVLSWPSP